MKGIIPILRFLASPIIRLKEAMDLTRLTRKGSFSQCGEDLLVKKILGNGVKTYVDVGANHPFRLSNTFLFYQGGASGICIDPIPTACKRLRRLRPRDTVICCAVSRENKTLPFYELWPSSLSCFDRERVETLVRNGQARFSGTYDVTFRSLSDIIKEEGNIDIDLLSIDTEGHDLDVLRSLDWAHQRPKVIITEKSDNNPSDTNAILDFLALRGYSTVGETAFNLILSESGDDRNG